MPTKKTYKQKVKTVKTKIQKNTKLNKAFFCEPNIVYAI